MSIIRRPLGASIAYVSQSTGQYDSKKMKDYISFPGPSPDGEDGEYLYKSPTTGSGINNMHWFIKDDEEKTPKLDKLIFVPTLTEQNRIRKEINDYYTSTYRFSDLIENLGILPIGVTAEYVTTKSKDILGYFDTSSYGLIIKKTLNKSVLSRNYEIELKKRTNPFDSGYSFTTGRESRPNFNPPLYPKIDNISVQSLPSSYRVGASAYPQPVVKIDTYGKLSTMIWIDIPNTPGAKMWATNEVNGIIIGGALTFTRSQIETAEPVQGGSVSTINSGKGLIDFRQKIRERITKSQPANDKANKLMPSIYPDLSISRIENRVNIGDPGNPDGKDLSTHDGANGSYAASYNSYDKINANDASGDEVTYPNNDLVNFGIGIYDYNVGGWTNLRFRAFLNSINDSYDAQWNSQRYIGRGENFYTYGSFDRKISLSWTVVAQSKREMIPMYQRLNTLASACAPNYNGNRSGYMKGNIANLNIGDYIQSYGLITKVSYEISEDSTWDVNIKTDAKLGTPVGELPHMIKVTSFEFIPINNSVPQFKTRFLYYGSGVQPGKPSRLGSTANSSTNSSTNTNPIGAPPGKYTMSTMDVPDDFLSFEQIPITNVDINSKPDYVGSNLVSNSAAPQPDRISGDVSQLNSQNTTPSSAQNSPLNNTQSSPSLTETSNGTNTANGITTQTIPTTALNSNNPTDNAINYGSYFPAYLLNPDSFSEESEVDDPLENAYYTVASSQYNEAYTGFESPTGPYLPGQEPNRAPAFSPDTNIFNLLPSGKTLSDFYVK